MSRNRKVFIPQKNTVLIDLTLSSDDEEDTTAGKKPRMEEREEQREQVILPVKTEPPPKKAAPPPPIISRPAPPAPVISKPASSVSSSPVKPPIERSKSDSVFPHPPPPSPSVNHRLESGQRKENPTTSRNHIPHSPNRDTVKSPSTTSVAGTGGTLLGHIPHDETSSSPVKGSNLGPKKLYLQKNSLPQEINTPIPSCSTSTIIPAIPNNVVRAPSSPSPSSVTATPAPSSSPVPTVATSQVESTKDLTNGASKEIMPTSVSPTNNSDSDKAPILQPEPVTEPLSNSPLPLQPPTLFPEVDVPVLPPSDSNQEKAMVSALRPWRPKYKIPKKHDPPPSSTNYHGPGQHNGSNKSSTSTATASQSDTKKIPTVERVAHQKGPANVLDTLLMTTLLQRTVEKLKETCDTPSVHRGRSNINSPQNLIPAAFRRNKVSPKRLANETNSTKNSNKSPEQTLLLEKKFEETQELLPTDLFELVDSTGLSKPQIQHWFAVRRRKLKDDSENEPPVGPPPPGPPPPGPPPPGGFPLDVEEPRDADDNGDVAHVPPELYNQSADPIPHNSGRGKQLKFLIRPELRTTDIATLQTDLNKVETCPLEYFQKILKSMWHRKAQNIFGMVHTNKEIKPVIMREARRIKDKFRVDPFSEAQHEELVNWKRQFLEEMAKDYPDQAQNNTYIVDEYIYPWVTPFIYSRLTKQDGHYLSLEVALQDFSHLYDSGTIHQWYTPSYIKF